MTSRKSLLQRLSTNNLHFIVVTNRKIYKYKNFWYIMNPLELIKEARERRKINRIAFLVLESLDLSNNGFEDCNQLRRAVSRALNDAGFRTTKILITSQPPDRYLGHSVRPNQVEHEAIGVHCGVLDPLYPRTLPLDKYLKRVYKPEEGVELVVTFQQA